MLPSSSLLGSFSARWLLLAFVVFVCFTVCDARRGKETSTNPSTAHSFLKLVEWMLLFLALLVAAGMGILKIAYPNTNWKLRGLYGLHKLIVFKMTYIDRLKSSDIGQSVESRALEVLITLQPVSWDLKTFHQVRQRVDSLGSLSKDINSVDLNIPHLRLDDSAPYSFLLGKWLIPPTSSFVPREFQAQLAPPPNVTQSVILYLHGGGFFSGSIESHKDFASELARRSRASCLIIDYRRSPEHPLPAACDDSLLAYRYLLNSQQLESNRIVIAGDSAGGALTLMLLLAIRDSGLPAPAAAVLISPVTDLCTHRPSFVSNAATDKMISPGQGPESMDDLRAQATGTAPEQREERKKFSPIHAELHGLPPMVICVSDQERLRDDAVDFAEAAQKAGVEVELIRYRNMQHVFPFFFHLIPEGDVALSSLAIFAGKKLGSVT